MLIELIANKEPEFNYCQCKGRDYHIDIQEIGEWITADYKTPDGNKRKLPIQECVQFPFTYDEYREKHHKKYYCPICKTFPYRIIGKS